MINNLLEMLSVAIKANFYLAPLLALVAGVLTSFTPCSLSTIPLVVSYVGGTAERGTKRAFFLSLTFAAGAAVTFTTLGVAASLAGRLIGVQARWWYVVLGVLMVLLAVQTWGIYEFIPSSYLISKSKAKGFVGAFVAGVLSGVFSSPCSTPVLIALLAIVSAGSSSLAASPVAAASEFVLMESSAAPAAAAVGGGVAWGAFLLLAYSVGHGALAVIAGTSVGFVKKLSSSEKYGKATFILKIVMGILMIAVAVYMFYLAF